MGDTDLRLVVLKDCVKIVCETLFDDPRNQSYYID